MESPESRITELEIKLGFAEDQIEELNLTAYRQQQSIEQLQAQLRRLYEMFQASGQGAEKRDLRDEIPPHY